MRVYKVLTILGIMAQTSGSGFATETSSYDRDWLQNNPCLFAQMNSLQRVDADLVSVEIDIEKIKNMVPFLFSKPSVAFQESGSTLALKVIEKSEKLSTSCKMKSNATVQALLMETERFDIPHVTCADLNEKYLSQFDLGVDIEIKEESKTSGPEFVFQKIKVEPQVGLTKIILPSLTTDVGEGRFAGMHYCKIVNPASITK